MYPTVFRKSFSDYDLVHANFGLTAPFAIAQPNRPIVLTLWGSDLSGEYGLFVKHCTKYCQEVIVRSEEMRDELSGDVHIIPSGIDMEQFRPCPQTNAQQSVGWDSSTKHVLFPYHPSRSVKNYPLAERVVKAVNKRHSERVHLQTVYDVNHDEVPTYMNAADALLLTSNREGSPNTVKEAMACNTPVVSTDVGDVGERLSGVKQSAVCQNGSELIESLLEILETGEPSDGRANVQDMSLERMGKRIIKLYEQAIM